MEHSRNLDETLISYILQEANAGQKTFVENWLSKNETNRLYFDQLVKTSGLIAVLNENEKINVEDEWQLFTKATISGQSAFITKQLPTENEIQPSQKLRRHKLYTILLSGAVAACLLVIAGITWKYFLSESPVKQNIAVVEKGDPPAVNTFEKVEVNNGSQPRRIVLNDGTLVTLSAKSEIRFADPFQGVNRNIYLKGQATFKVARDKLRPFTIFSGDISTTALGTMFTVTAFENEGRITVSLFEGKVVVASVANARLSLKKKFYLYPGQELVYFSKNATAKVISIKKKREEAAPPVEKNDESVAVDNPNIPLHDLGSWYMFNNQSLSQVFDQLESLYNVEIVYNKKDVQKIYFIGKFNKADSLQNVLKQITKLNGLVIEKRNNTYYIVKLK